MPTPCILYPCVFCPSAADAGADGVPLGAPTGGAMATTARPRSEDRSMASDVAMDVRTARVQLYSASVPYPAKRQLAASLATHLTAAAPRDVMTSDADGRGAGGVTDAQRGPVLAGLLTEWSLAVLTHGGLTTRAADRAGAGAGATAGPGGKRAKGGGKYFSGMDGKEGSTVPGSIPGGGAKNPSRAPRAVGTDAPTDAARLCKDAVPWRALVAGLTYDDGPGGAGGVGGGGYQPAAAAAAHIMHAAAASVETTTTTTTTKGCAGEGASPSETVAPADVAAALAGLRERLRAQFRPAADQCLAVALAAASAAPRQRTRHARARGTDDDDDALAAEALLLLERAVRSTPHRAPPAMASTAVDALIHRAAAAAKAADVAPRGVHVAALGALRALLLHPTHLAGVPSAFAAADVAASEASSPPGRPAKRARPSEENPDENRTGDLSEEAKALNLGAPPPVPAFVSLIAARIVRSAAEGTDRSAASVARLAAWALTSFVDESADLHRSAADQSARAARGGGPISGGPAAAASERGARLLFDALFAPLLAAEEATAADQSDGAARKTSKARANRRSRSATTDPQSADVDGDLSAATWRREEAAALMRAARRAGLYSPAAAGGGPAPPWGGRPPIRDRLSSYAAAVLSPRALEGGDVVGVAAAADALLGLDPRLVEPHAASLIAATWATPVGCAAPVVGLVARTIEAYAATRQLPELLSAAGAAAASVVDRTATRGTTRMPRGVESESVVVIDAPEVLRAATAAAGGVPRGQIPATVKAVHAALSLACGARDGPRKETSKTETSVQQVDGETVVALGALLASVLAALPAPPGDPLPAGATEALEALTGEIESRLADFITLTRRPSDKTKAKDASFGAVAAAGALLRVYTPASSMLEVCHSRDALHGAAVNRAYLGSTGPSLAETVTGLLAGRWAGGRLSSSAGRSIGAAAAGAALHRVAQLSRVARPPPAGAGDAAAGTEARELVAGLLASAGGAGGVKRAGGVSGDDSSVDPRAAAVGETLTECADVWVEWAAPGELREWVKGGGDDVFADPKLAAVWSRTVAEGALNACETVCEATRTGSLIAAARAVVDAGRATADHEGSGPGPSGDAQRSFWGAAVDAMGDEDALKKTLEDASGSSKKTRLSGKTPKRGGVSGAMDGEALRALRRSMEELAVMPAACTAHVDAASLAAAAAAADCVAFAFAAELTADRTAHAAADRASADLALALSVVAAARDVTAKLAMNSDERSEADGEHICPAPMAAATLALAAKVNEAAVLPALRDVAVATARLTHAALVLGGLGALRATVSVVAAAGDRLAEELRRSAAAAEAKRTKKSAPDSAPALVPRALRLKAAAEKDGTARAAGAASGDDARRDVGPFGVLAAALSEATLSAALDRVPPVDRSSALLGEADPTVGDAVVESWTATAPLRLAVDAALAALADTHAISTPRGSGFVEGASATLAAAAAAAAAAGMGMRHAPLNASGSIPDPAALFRALSVATAALGGRWTADHPRAAAKAASLVEAAVGVLTATNEPLSAEAHATLLASVASAYDVAARHAAVSTRRSRGDTNVLSDRRRALPSPPGALRRALDGALAALLKGAGKRRLGAAYAFATTSLRSFDAAARRLAPLGLTRSDDGHSSGWDIAAGLAAPVWCLGHLLGGGMVSKAARLATERHAEEAVAALCQTIRAATEGGVGPPCGAPARAVVRAALEALTALAARGDRCALSARCVARMAQAAALGVQTAGRDASAAKMVFTPGCALLAALLRCRRVELKRSAALVTAACGDLLDAMRAWNHLHQLRRRPTTASSLAPPSALGAAGVSSTEAEAALEAERHAAGMRAAATALVPVYEEANAAGLNRYCAHLLADAVTACVGSGGAGVGAGGGGIGAVAERALRPGLFALLDACGDRELRQLHGALGSSAGGARRVVLAALIEEHRRSHRYDGKV